MQSLAHNSHDNDAPGFRKFALTAHVTSSVGTLGAVAGFLALAVAGLNSADSQVARAAYLAMELIAWYGFLAAYFINTKCLYQVMMSLISTKSPRQVSWGDAEAVERNHRCAPPCGA
ncbi:hypothetical protein [Mesorhizobium sp.]|uniref:hypothetical protein n=1 Tax=Mesorhizobium sp. TaxID=1871066 RepID=UPI00257A9355|nr:hypothetical protein [Mesorhizobium sp.]